jgi:predicted GH43/DUF377 family glycosyl hydrolase
VSDRELFRRHPANPLLTAEQWPYRVNAVFNPAAAVVDGHTVLVVRAEDRRGISHLALARSTDGKEGWAIAPEPLLAPEDGVESEEWGFEDARVVWVDELGCFVITCTAYGPAGPSVYLATTRDFASVERRGVIRQPEDKNAALLPHRIDGTWALLHRPKTELGGEIFLSRSADLVSWSTPEHARSRVPARGGLPPHRHRAPPLRTEHGWLLVYHGVKRTVAGEIYRIGLALLDLDEPTRVLHRYPSWVIAPLAPYERTGDVPNVVFPCGLVHDVASGELRLYYGAADTSVCLATAQLDEVVAAVLTGPPGD